MKKKLLSLLLALAMCLSLNVPAFATVSPQHIMTSAQAQQYEADTIAFAEVGWDINLFEIYSISDDYEIHTMTLPRNLASYTAAALCAVVGAVLFAANPTIPIAIRNAILLNPLSDLIESAVEHPLYSGAYLSYCVEYYEHEDSYSLDRLYRCEALFFSCEECPDKSDPDYSEGIPCTYYYRNYFF